MACDSSRFFLIKKKARKLGQRKRPAYHKLDIICYYIRTKEVKLDHDIKNPVRANLWL